MRHTVLCWTAGLLLASLCAAAGEPWTFRNITARTYENEVFRLPIKPPAGSVTVRENGKEIPSLVDEVEGERILYVRSTIEAGKTYTYEVATGQPFRSECGVKVRTEGDRIVMENGQFGVQLPARATGEAPCPIRALQLDGKWVGQGRWVTPLKLKSFQATVLDDGNVMGKVRLRYEFEGLAGLSGDIPAYAEVDVSLLPGRPFAVIEERHEMPRRSAWEFEPTADWKPTGGHCRWFGSSFGQGGRNKALEATLKPGQITYQPPELLINLFPRWNQHYKDGWYCSAVNETSAAGVLVTLAGRWYWPHDNAVQGLVKESGDSLTWRFPTWRGIRYWFLCAGPKGPLTEGIQNLAQAHAYDALDTILSNVPIRDWEGAGGQYRGFWPLGGHINPSAGWRGTGSAAIRNAGQEINDIGHLTYAQVVNSPNAYGSYWLFWSPENPNFFTDFTKAPIGYFCNLRKHPRVAEIARMAEQRFHEDMYNSVTLPGGAGNECPGYQQYGMHHYLTMAEACKQYLGFDATQWPRFKAAPSFGIHISTPLGLGKRGLLPAGDTHPGHAFADPREFGAKFGVEADVTTFRTEELPNFGAVFRNRCGQAAETFFSFKSGPARGHFHGDQLAFHYCAYSRPLIVDHHCSYGPHAGQEHMHNRVAFHTDELPYANMDGFERLIAFKTGDAVDAAMGQVESYRLRNVQKFPPQFWHEEWPQVQFEQPLIYRRTVVMLRGERDCFVIRDQYAGEKELNASYCLHVYGETCEQKERAISFDGVTAYVAAPEQFAVSRHDWEHGNGGREATKGLRVTMKGKQGEFITVLIPRPYKRCHLARLTLKGAVVRENNNLKDVRAILVCEGDRPTGATPVFEAPGYNTGRCTGTVDVANAEAGWNLGIALTVGDDKWVKGGPAQLAVQLRREGDGYAGSFKGTFNGKEVSGAVEGTMERDAFPPQPVFADDPLPDLAPLPGGVKVGDTVVTFSGGLDDNDATSYVTVQRGDQTVFTLTGKDVDLDRPQGEIGLFVPDAGYPFGEVPDWLARQRLKVPNWAPEWAKKMRARRQ